MTSENEQLRQLLKEVDELLVMAEVLPPKDPDYYDVVDQLGHRIGFGALMACATLAWRKYLESKGMAGAEFVCSPCRITVTQMREKISKILEKN